MDSSFSHVGYVFSYLMLLDLITLIMFANQYKLGSSFLPLILPFKVQIFSSAPCSLTFTSMSFPQGEKPSSTSI